MAVEKRRVTDTPDGIGAPVLVVESTETGMVSVYVPGEMAWVTPATAERMATALAGAARSVRGQQL